MNYKSEFQLLLSAYESILPFDMHVKFSLTLMGVTQAYYGITRPLGVNIYFRQTSLLKFIRKKKGGGGRDTSGGRKICYKYCANKSTILCIFDQQEAWNKKSHIGVQLHPCASSSLHTGTCVKMCTSMCALVRESLCSVTPNFGAKICLSSCSSAQLQHSPWSAQFTPAEQVTQGLWECWSPGSLLQALCEVAAALNANGCGSTEHWHRGVISFMGTFP